MEETLRTILREQSEKQEKWERVQTEKQETWMRMFSGMVQRQQELLDKHGEALMDLSQ